MMVGVAIKFQAIRFLKFTVTVVLQWSGGGCWGKRFNMTLPFPHIPLPPIFKHFL